jgi:hypothetical protein
VDTVATVEGLDPATVRLVARYIREVKLIAKRGRGPSAAAMGLRDAANLLIGVNATRVAAEAATAVSVYRELEAHEFRVAADPRPPVKYATLGAAIEQLLDAIGAGELPEQFLDKGVPFDLQTAFAGGEVHVELKFRVTTTSAFLGIAMVPEPDAISRSDVELNDPRSIDPQPGGSTLYSWSRAEAKCPSYSSHVDLAS